MIVIYSSDHQTHDPEFELYDDIPVAYAETAQRSETIMLALQSQPEHVIIEPKHFGLRHILAIHQREYVDFIEERAQQLPDNGVLYPSYFMSDTYAPITAGTYGAARQSVNTALTGADLILAGESVTYSLCRPPGHHAGHHAMGGYCYFNNAAIAAQYLSNKGRVAILDIDFHHGNGSQDAFYDRSDVFYVSLHADPRDRYPYSSGFLEECGRGKGNGYNVNAPLPLGTNDASYLRHLSRVLERIRDFAPDYVVVSAGFDTFVGDPIGGFALTPGVYHDIGRIIARLKLPTLIVQEGGYNVDYLGELVTNFLDGISSEGASF